MRKIKILTFLMNRGWVVFTHGVSYNLFRVRWGSSHSALPVKNASLRCSQTRTCPVVCGRSVSVPVSCLSLELQYIVCAQAFLRISSYCSFGYRTNLNATYPLTPAGYYFPSTISLVWSHHPSSVLIVHSLTVISALYYIFNLVSQVVVFIKCWRVSKM